MAQQLDGFANASPLELPPTCPTCYFNRFFRDLERAESDLLQDPVISFFRASWRSSPRRANHQQHQHARRRTLHIRTRNGVLTPASRAILLRLIELSTHNSRRRDRSAIDLNRPPPPPPPPRRMGRAPNVNPRPMNGGVRIPSSQMVGFQFQPLGVNNVHGVNQNVPPDLVAPLGGGNGGAQGGGGGAAAAEYDVAVEIDLNEGVVEEDEDMDLSLGF